MLASPFCAPRFSRRHARALKPTLCAWRPPQYLCRSSLLKVLLLLLNTPLAVGKPPLVPLNRGLNFWAELDDRRLDVTSGHSSKSALRRLCEPAAGSLVFCGAGEESDWLLLEHSTISSRPKGERDYRFSHLLSLDIHDGRYNHLLAWSEVMRFPRKWLRPLKLAKDNDFTPPFAEPPLSFGWATATTDYPSFAKGEGSKDVSTSPEVCRQQLNIGTCIYRQGMKRYLQCLAPRAGL